MTIIRPFYFLVHPDLFGRFPQEQKVNEQSMKVLNSYIDSQIKVKSPGQESKKQVTFYMRSNQANMDRWNLVINVILVSIIYH